jgi:glutathione S-transferase
MNALLADPVVRLYGFCAAVLVIKMLVTANLTGVYRTSRKVYATPEDYRFFGQEPVSRRDEDIERIRRSHQNDLENILPFLGIGLVYALSGPSYTMAAVLFIVFTVSRVLYTVVYVAGLQPWRTILFAVAQIALYVTAIATLLRML